MFSWLSAERRQVFLGPTATQTPLAGTLYLGVAKDENKPEKLFAHAWLRYGHINLTGARRVIGNSLWSPCFPDGINLFKSICHRSNPFRPPIKVREGNGDPIRARSGHDARS